MTRPTSLVSAPTTDRPCQSPAVVGCLSLVTSGPVSHAVLLRSRGRSRSTTGAMACASKNRRLLVHRSPTA